MRLQETVQVLPGLGDPVDDLNQVITAHVLVDLRLYQLPPQKAAQEAFHRLRVVGAQHPPRRNNQSAWHKSRSDRIRDDRTTTQHFSQTGKKLLSNSC